MQLTDQATIPQLLRNVVKYIHPETDTFMLEKVNEKYVPITYKETLDKADRISSYFLANGIHKADRIGFIIENCPEYVFYDQALQQLGCINVSIYPTLADDDVEYIINDSQLKMILVGTHFLLKKLIKIAPNCPSLTHIIPKFDDYHKMAESHNGSAKIISLNEVIESGAKTLDQYKGTINTMRDDVKPSDLSSLIYTSGTTGTPKGVMLSHLNFCHNVKVSLIQIPHITSEETFLSFLPLSHVFERTATYHICCAQGSKIAFAQSLELLGKNMMEVKPTVMSVVPRLLEKINEKAMKNGTSAGGLKSKIFLWSIDTGSKYRNMVEAGKTPGFLLSIQRNIAEKLVFSKIKEKTGGSLKFIISGGAALPQNIGEFFGNLGIKVLEGYGLTETSPVMAVTEFTRQVYGTVGRVLPEITIGIQDADTKRIITEQTHDTFDPNFESEEGEIILRGNNVMQGYWNKPEDTANAIDKDGWFHTGDVGKFYKGNLKITDRIKNMLVNSYGKNVYPTPIENTYLQSNRIDQLFLIGDKREYITAIIVPSKENMMEQFGLTEAYFQESDLFIRDENIVNWVNEHIRKYSSELAKFERIKGFILKRNPFTIDDGEMTPTLKIKRRVVEKKFANEIDEMYELEEMSEV
jgi:long-chain acyl-CoA synthetase